jgi:hypothetical protein
MDPEVAERQRYPIDRQATIGMWRRLTAAIEDLPRCGPDGCPACWDGEACPRDELTRRMAPAMLDPVWERGVMLKGFSISAWLPATDTRAGWFSHRREGSLLSSHQLRGGVELADAALAFLLRTYRIYGQEKDAQIRVVFHLTRVIRAGCLDPSVTEMWAWELSRPGRAGDLRAAVEACELALTGKPPDTTASAWRSLGLTRDNLVARLLRMERGPASRHHPGDAAKRTRPLRFVSH